MSAIEKLVRLSAPVKLAHSLDTVREAFNARRRRSGDGMEAGQPYAYVREVWTDFVVVEQEGQLLKIPYSADGGKISFDTPVPVRVEYVEIEGS